LSLAISHVGLTCLSDNACTGFFRKETSILEPEIVRSTLHCSEPLLSQHFEKPSVAAVAKGDMNDLRWSAKQQRSIVEVHVLAQDDETLYSPALPNLRIRRR
jgi:hypothetical protein